MFEQGAAGPIMSSSLTIIKHNKNRILQIWNLFVFIILYSVKLFKMYCKMFYKEIIGLFERLILYVQWVSLNITSPFILNYFFGIEILLILCPFYDIIFTKKNYVTQGGFLGVSVYKEETGRVSYPINWCILADSYF